MDVPVEEGHSWENGVEPTNTYVWARETGPITVTAGTFTDCWTTVTQPGGSDQRTTYCRGVGVVRTHSTFTTGYVSDVELLSKSF
jgi:hypothetical protein